MAAAVSALKMTFSFHAYSPTTNCKAVSNATFAQISPPVSLYYVRLLERLDQKNIHPPYLEDLNKFHQPTSAITSPRLSPLNLGKSSKQEQISKYLRVCSDSRKESLNVNFIC